MADPRGSRSSTRFGDAAAALDLNALAEIVLDSVDRAASSRWDAAVARAAALPPGVRPQKVKALTDSFARELAAIGAATGAAAAAPAVGTVATLAAATAELAWFTTRAGDLVLTIAALHGRHDPTVDERRAWVMAVLLFGSTAREGFTGLANRTGAGLGTATSNRLPIASLRAVNSTLSRMLVKRYGTRRGALALGRALPLGIGAAIGGGANYAAVRSLARHADRFFARLPYSAIETGAREVPAT